MFSVTQTTIAARSVRLNTTTKRDVTRRYARAHTHSSSFSRRCIFFTALSLSLSLSEAPREFMLFHVMGSENVKLQKKKNAARALLLLESSLIREREKERDARPKKQSSRSRFLREKKFLERGKEALLERACSISCFGFFVNVYTFPTASKTRRRGGVFFFQTKKVNHTQ